jgi:hypothetical protein
VTETETQTQADTSPRPSVPDGWDDFINRPVTYTHPMRLSVCFGGEIGPVGCARLLETRRMTNRISFRILKAYDLSDCAAPESADDLAIALASAEELQALARRAGAICWSNTLAGLVLARDADAMSKMLGDDVWMLALKNRDLGGPARSIDTVENAMTELENDGWRCLSAWCCAQGEGIGRRVRLKLPPNPELDVEPEGPIAQTGQEIARRAIHKDEPA